MHSGSSKTIKPTPSGASKPGGKLNTATKDQSSRTRNTSGGDSSGNGKWTVKCDGRDITPRPLVPSYYQKDKGDGLGGPSGSIGGIGDQASGEEGFQPTQEELHPTPAPPPVEKKKPPATLSREELEKNVDIVLAETETETLISFPSLCVALDNPQSSKVSERNKAYDELCLSKADSDQYREQHAQTLNQPPKSKEVYAAPPSQENQEVNANGWDIYDTFATDPVPKHEQIQQACDKESAITVAQAIKKPGCLFTMNEPYPISNEQGKDQAPKKGGKDDAKKKQGVSGLKAGVSTMSGGGTGGGSGGGSAQLGGGASRQMAGGPSGTNQAAGALESGPTGGSQAANASEREGANPSPGAGDADGKGDETKAEDEAAEPTPPPAPAELIPWKVGAETPIPEELSKSLRVMERIVSQNVFHKQHMIYRNYPTLEELALLDELRTVEAMAGETADMGSGANRPAAMSADAEAGEGYTGEDGDAKDDEDAPDETGHDDSGGASDRPYLQDLFCFDAPQLTQGMTVTCAEWNRHNQDLLAVSYGDTAPVPSQRGGLLLFWSLKNPTYPERVISTRHGVTALHFSSVHPNMVAAGTHDGSVMIWDLRRPSDKPVLGSGPSSSTHTDQKHTDIVWETRWVDQGPDKQPPELLVSVSSDGQVLQWSMKKGLEQTVLMQLKRLLNPNLGSNSVYGHKEGIVFRRSSGFCVDFPRHDPSTYLVGTEDGLVHRCSTSYNEQYLETYYGHSGPVYRVRCNPFMSHAFLTCSADWSMKLWTTKALPNHPLDSPLLTFQSQDLMDAVNDVTWAPQNSTCFAAAMDDGRVELWDLSEKPLDPIVVHYPQAQQNLRRRRTCVRFSPNSPVLIAGDNQGCVDVMRMYNTNQSYYSDQEQQDRLNAVMVKKR